MYRFNKYKLRSYLVLMCVENFVYMIKWIVLSKNFIPVISLNYWFHSNMMMSANFHSIMTLHFHICLSGHCKNNLRKKKESRAFWHRVTSCLILIRTTLKNSRWNSDTRIFSWCPPQNSTSLPTSPKTLDCWILDFWSKFFA